MNNKSIAQTISSYLSKKDVFLLIIGCLCSVIFGGIISGIQFIDGKMINTYKSSNGN